MTAGAEVEFFEGCLSVSEFSALVARPLEVQVDCLDHLGRPVSFRAEGWHARIVQHEVDHLRGMLYIDRMRSRSLTTIENLRRYWNDLPVQQVIEEIGAG